MNDFHDYANGTRARRWIGMIFRPLLRVAVKSLLWLCPDTPIVANVYIGYRGSAIHLKPNAKDGLIINVRIDGAYNAEHMERAVMISQPIEANEAITAAVRATMPRWAK